MEKLFRWEVPWGGWSGGAGCELLGGVVRVVADGSLVCGELWISVGDGREIWLEEVQGMGVFCGFGLWICEVLRGLLMGWLVMVGEAEVWLMALPW